VKGCPNDGNWKSSAAMPRVRVDKDWPEPISELKSMWAVDARRAYRLAVVRPSLNTSNEDLIGTREVAAIGTKRETVTKRIGR
jgi:hypothetical protein